MGQILKKKRKGRPPKSDPTAARGGGGEAPAKSDRDVRRSLRRRNVKYVFDLDDYFDDDEVFEEDDEEQRRREKKLKLLLKLDESHAPPTSSSEEEEEEQNRSKKQRIDDEYEANDEVNYNEEEEEEEVGERKPESRVEEDSPPGTPMEAPTGVPLLDSKALELILDKLQKKDIYGVYAEPVDPEELPDYHEVIKNPMDFGTVRSKLRNGLYTALEELESDVFLICSNAMQYNAPDTVYHKQARTIKELAKRKFEKIRLNSGCSEREIKHEQQKISSSPSVKKQIIRSVSRTMQEPAGSDFSSGATLATPVDINSTSNALLAVGYERPGSSGAPVEGNSFLNDNNLDKGEETPPGKVQLSKFGRKTPVQDENRRATYNISLPQPEASLESIFSTFEEESKQLVPVGLYSDHSYARSLARFAASLGPVAWEVASKRIEQALPEGFKFGRGWVGEYEPLPTPVLMLENCIVKEPAFLAKVQPPADLRKSEKNSIVSDFSKESSGNGPILGDKLPFSGPTGIRAPFAPIVTTSLSIKEHPIRGNDSEVKPNFFLSPRTKPGASTNNNYPNQNTKFADSDKRTPADSDNKVWKQVELNDPPIFNKNALDTIGHRQIPNSSEINTSRPLELTSRNANFAPSGSFKERDSNGVASGGLPNGKVTGNRLNSNTTARSSSNMAKGAVSNPREQQGQQGLTDPVQLMKMMAEKSQNQQKASNHLVPDASQVSFLAPSSSVESNNAAAAAARAWMSVGAVGFRPPIETTNAHKNQLHADSFYNSTRGSQPQVPRYRGEFPASVMPVQQGRNMSPLHAFVPHGPIPMRVGNGMPFQTQQMAFPQMMTADLSRFQLPSNWSNLSPQMISRQKPESLPPDLNIGFQSSGSPGRPSSGVMVDSQQPDLALQL